MTSTTATNPRCRRARCRRYQQEGSGSPVPPRERQRDPVDKPPAPVPLPPGPPHPYRALRDVTRVAVVAALLGFAAAALRAQGSWVGPRLPCALTPGPSKVSAAIQALKTAAEKPDQRSPQLAQAKRLLTEAIVQEKQEPNPAAWYYLGRYALEAIDAAGADSAFARALALAPKCADDIAEHRHELWEKLLTDGLAAWQDGRPDSALTLLRVAARLEPTNPKALATVAGLYSSRGNDDSACAYYPLAGKAAGSDSAVAKQHRDTLADPQRR